LAKATVGQLHKKGGGEKHGGAKRPKGLTVLPRNTKKRIASNRV